jgi:hypothetical protein
MIDNNFLKTWVYENLKSTHNQDRRAFNMDKIKPDMVPKSGEIFWINSQ